MGSVCGVPAMEQSKHLILEEGARLTEIQDSLIDRYVEQQEALEEGNRCRAIEIEFEIKELLHEKRKLSSARYKTDIWYEVKPQMHARR